MVSVGDSVMSLGEEFFALHGYVLEMYGSMEACVLFSETGKSKVRRVTISIKDLVLCKCGCQHGENYH